MAFVKLKPYRPPSPLSLDSFSGIYIGPEEKRKKTGSDEEGKVTSALVAQPARLIFFFCFLGCKVQEVGSYINSVE